MVNQKNVFCHLFPFYSPVKILPISKFCSEPFVSTPSTSEFCFFWTQAQWWVPSDTPVSNYCTMIKNWTKGQWEEHFLFISFCAGMWGVTICLYNLLAPKAYKGWLSSVNRFIQLICIIFYAKKKKKARKYKVKMAVIDHWHLLEGRRNALWKFLMEAQRTEFPAILEAVVQRRVFPILPSSGGEAEVFSRLSLSLWRCVTQGRERGYIFFNNLFFYTLIYDFQIFRHRVCRLSFLQLPCVPQLLELSL